MKSQRWSTNSKLPFACTVGTVGTVGTALEYIITVASSHATANHSCKPTSRIVFLEVIRRGAPLHNSLLGTVTIVYILCVILIDISNIIRIFYLNELLIA